MESSLPDDIVMTISTYLPSSARALLSQTGRSYSVVLNKARDDQVYWLKKLELLLDIVIPASMYDRPHNWKLAYVQARKNPLLLFTGNDEDFYNIALLAGIDPSQDGNFAFLTACVRGNISAVIRLLADPRVDPATMYSNSIKLAAERGHIDILDVLLLDCRADPTDHRDGDPIELCINENQQNSAIRLLQDDRVRLTHVDYVSSMLNYAIYHSNDKVTHYILEEMDILGHLNTSELLITVAYKGDEESVDFLLGYPSTDPTYTDNKAIRGARAAGHREIVAALLNIPKVRRTLNKEELRKCLDLVRNG